jgi:hypothetical protein
VAYYSRPYLKRSFGRVLFEGSYNQGWVAAVKAMIPASDRHYDRTIWDFEPRWYGCIKEITEFYYGGGYIDSTGGVSEPQVASWKEKWDVYKSLDGARDTQERKQKYDAPPPRTYKTRLSEAFATLYVTEAAPPEVITAAYRGTEQLESSR